MLRTACQPTVQRTHHMSDNSLGAPLHQNHTLATSLVRVCRPELRSTPAIGHNRSVALDEILAHPRHAHRAILHLRRTKHNIPLIGNHRRISSAVKTLCQRKIVTSCSAT